LSGTGKDSSTGGSRQHLSADPGSPSSTIWLGILGPLQVRVNGSELSSLPPAQQVVLALLALADGSLVRTEILNEALWRGDPPVSAVGIVQTYVSRLRTALGYSTSDRETCLQGSTGGYRLKLSDEELDVRLFRARLSEAQKAADQGETARACAAYERALALWRGAPLDDIEVLRGHPSAVALAAEHTSAVLDYAVAGTACGWHEQVLTELRSVAVKNPLDEVVQAQLMITLAASGHQAQALQAYEAVRYQLDAELGVSPGPVLRDVHARILREEIRPSAPETIHLASSQRPVPTESRPNMTDPARPIEVVLLREQAALSRHGIVNGGPAQLPADIADFTGREDYVRRLCEVLTATTEVSTGVVTIALISGSGGLGKTSLAIHVAHRLSAEFPGGQLYADLKGATADPVLPAEALGSFLRDLNVEGTDVPLEEAGRAARYRTALAGRRVLVVLDNARDAAQVRPLLPGSASCAVLVTTRNRMPDLASTKLMDLNVLDEDEALTLFTRVVGDERVAAEPEATAELLLACAGLPLAIRICAARLVTRTGWTIRAMANRLRDEHRRLDEMTVGDLAVRASFEVSFASLTTTRRGVDPAQAFRLLGLWHGPTISSAAAAALFDATEDEAADALDILVDAHLLESKSPDRYKFHDLLRVYSSERAVSDVPDNLREEAVERLLGWYMHTVDAAAQAISLHRYTMPLNPAGPPALSFTDPDEAFGWYNDERVNITAATRQAAAAGLHDIAWRLPAPLFIMATRRGNWAELIATHQIALDSARQAGNRQGEAWLLNNLGDALGRQGDPVGIGHLEQALEIAREIGDREGEVRACNNLGDVLEALGREEEALEHLQRTLELCREWGNPYQEGAALTNMGSVLIKLNRTGEAIDFLEQAWRTLVDAGQSGLAGYPLNSLGRLYLSENRFADALDCLSRAVDSHRADGNRHQQAVSLQLLGTAQARTGMTEEARDSLAGAIAIFEELGDTAMSDQVRAERSEI
jgi:DNA-binding SARP family transcriptional activator/tetratricopeptide (TPR) repeat protein